MPSETEDSKSFKSIIAIPKAFKVRKFKSEDKKLYEIRKKKKKCSVTKNSYKNIKFLAFVICLFACWLFLRGGGGGGKNGVRLTQAQGIINLLQMRTE